MDFFEIALFSERGAGARDEDGKIGEAICTYISR
jgi:hypothetical protein